MSTVSLTGFTTYRTSFLPGSSQGVTLLGWWRDNRVAAGAAGACHAISSSTTLAGSAGAFIGAYRPSATPGLYRINRATGSSFAGYAEADVVTSLNPVGLALISEASGIRSYYTTQFGSGLNTGPTLAATSFTPAMYWVESSNQVSVGGMGLFNRVLSLEEIFRQLKQRALRLSGAVFWTSGTGPTISRDETPNGDMIISAGSETLSTLDPGVPWRRHVHIL